MASQTIAGPDLQFTQDNKHCYGYSGIKDISGDTTMLDFETNSEYIKGVFEFNADFATGGGASVRLQIFFNDIMVMQERDVSSDWNTGDNEFRFIIPPFTHVVANVLGGSQDANVNFTGRVYEHLPVRN